MPKTIAERLVVTGQYIKDRYHLNDRWLERHIDSGDLRPLKAGRLNRFYLDEVVAYFERERGAS